MILFFVFTFIHCTRAVQTTHPAGTLVLHMGNSLTNGYYQAFKNLACRQIVVFVLTSITYRLYLHSGMIYDDDLYYSVYNPNSKKINIVV